MESVKKSFSYPFYAFLSLQYWTDSGTAGIPSLHRPAQNRQAATHAHVLLCCSSCPDTRGIDAGT